MFTPDQQSQEDYSSIQMSKEQWAPTLQTYLQRHIQGSWSGDEFNESVVTAAQVLENILKTPKGELPLDHVSRYSPGHLNFLIQKVMSNISTLPCPPYKLNSAPTFESLFYDKQVPLEQKKLIFVYLAESQGLHKEPAHTLSGVTHPFSLSELEKIHSDTYSHIDRAKHEFEQKLLEQMYCSDSDAEKTRSILEKSSQVKKQEQTQKTIKVLDEVDAYLENKRSSFLMDHTRAEKLARKLIEQTDNKKKPLSISAKARFCLAAPELPLPPMVIYEVFALFEKRYEVSIMGNTNPTDMLLGLEKSQPTNFYSDYTKVKTFLLWAVENYHRHNQVLFKESTNHDLDIVQQLLHNKCSGVTMINGIIAIEDILSLNLLPQGDVGFYVQELEKSKFSTIEKMLPKTKAKKLDLTPPTATSKHTAPTAKAKITSQCTDEEYETMLSFFPENPFPPINTIIKKVRKGVLVGTALGALLFSLQNSSGSLQPEAYQPTKESSINTPTPSVYSAFHRMRTVAYQRLGLDTTTNWVSKHGEVTIEVHSKYFQIQELHKKLSEYPEHFTAEKIKTAANKAIDSGATLEQFLQAMTKQYEKHKAFMNLPPVELTVKYGEGISQTALRMVMETEHLSYQKALESKTFQKIVQANFQLTEQGSYNNPEMTNIVSPNTKITYIPQTSLIHLK